jgi:DNA-binding NarL/FixJ family response regulator
MPVLDGVATVAEIKTHWPQVLVLMYTVFDDDDKLFQAIRAGADGYLLKGTPVGDLHRYIEEALAGGAPMSPIIARKSLRLLRNRDTAKTANNIAAVEQLTDREIEVLTHLASGLTYQRIADNLFISLGTVRKHVEHIYRKLRVDNRTRAVQRGKEEGWL